jgi:hypothetical protein
MALDDLWESAEEGFNDLLLGHTDRSITLFGALPLNIQRSNPSLGQYSLWGYHRKEHLLQMDHQGRPLENVLVDWWGEHGCSIWCFDGDRAVNEADARRWGIIRQNEEMHWCDSYTPVGENSYWLVLNIKIELEILVLLQSRSHVTVGAGWEDIPALSFHGTVDRIRVTKVDLAYLDKTKTCDDYPAQYEVFTWSGVTRGWLRIDPHAVCSTCASVCPTWRNVCTICWFRMLMQGHMDR